MFISQREITQEELHMIYDDFKKIEIEDGVPQQEEVRYQFTAEENGEVIEMNGRKVLKRKSTDWF